LAFAIIILISQFVSSAKIGPNKLSQAAKPARSGFLLQIRNGTPRLRASDRTTPGMNFLTKQRGKRLRGGALASKNRAQIDPNAAVGASL
jgi:hypothetical protein